MKVKFLPQNIELEIDSSTSVMQAAHEKGIYIKSVCNGMPSCAECRVKIIEGEGKVLPPTSKELDLIGTGHFIDRRRLSCQLKCFGDVVVDLSEQVEKEKTSTQRRPQGSFQKESTEESLAVTGNLLDQDKELLKEDLLQVDEDEEIKSDAFFEGVVETPEKKEGQKQGGSSQNKRRQNKHRSRRQNNNNNNKK